MIDLGSFGHAEAIVSVFHDFVNIIVNFFVFLMRIHFFSVLVVNNILLLTADRSALMEA